MEFYESFMKFSFADDDVFRIEEDPLINDIEGNKSCECVVLLNPNVALIEAKSSSPQPVNQDKFKVYIDDIKRKFSDSLRLFNEIKTKVHGEEAYLRLPINLQGITITPDLYLIILIIHGHQLDRLVGLIDALRDSLREVVNQWNIKDSNIKVFNEEEALRHQLIVAYVPKQDRDALRDPDGNMNQELAQQWFDAHS